MKIYIASSLKYRPFWTKALNFCGLSFTFLAPGELPPAKSILLADNSDDTLRNHLHYLSDFVINGGKVLLVGGTPCGADLLLPNLTSTYTNRGTSCRAPEIIKPFDGFLPGDALLFCLDFNERKRHKLKGEIPKNTTIYARTLKIERNSATGYLSFIERDDTPLIMGIKSGTGHLIYTPCTTTVFQDVLQPIVPYSPINYFTVKNHGAIRLLKALFTVLLPSISFTPVFPNETKCAVSITGDVHDYSGIPEREDREWDDMIHNMNLLKELGLEGKAAYYLSAVVCEKHPDIFCQALDRGYEIQAHTYVETQYEVEKWDYKRQFDDLALCQSIMTNIYGKEGSFVHGHRTHGYQSNYITREALFDLGKMEYIADMQAWEVPDMLSPELKDAAILYLALPQRCYGANSRMLPLLEIPDTVANDHFCYRVYKYSPDEALAFWISRFDRIYRLGGYWQTCLHPYIAIQEAPGREEAYISLIKHMQSKPGVAFINPLELVHYYRNKDGLII